MKAVLAVVLALAVAANAGVLTTSVHEVHTPLVHAAPVHYAAPIVHAPVATSFSSAYKYKAPPAKLVAYAPSLPIVHSAPVYSMSPDILLHH